MAIGADSPHFWEGNTKMSIDYENGECEATISTEDMARRGVWSAICSLGEVGLISRTDKNGTDWVSVEGTEIFMKPKPEQGGYWYQRELDVGELRMQDVGHGAELTVVV